MLPVSFFEVSIWVGSDDGHEEPLGHKEANEGHYSSIILCLKIEEYKVSGIIPLGSLTFQYLYGVDVWCKVSKVVQLMHNLHGKRNLNNHIKIKIVSL